MRKFAEMFVAMSMAVSFAEEGEFEMAESFLGGSGLYAGKVAQNTTRRSINSSRKRSMRA